MRDRLVVWLGLFTLLAVTLACNAFAGRPESALPPPPQPTQAGLPDNTTPQSGLAPTATLPTEATAPSGQGILRVLVDLNVRAGPGVGYRRVGFLLRDATAIVLGRDTASGWWKIACPPAAEGDECWVSGGTQYTRAENVDVPPTVVAPATPTPTPPDPPGGALLAYVNGGRLFVTTIDLGGSPTTAAESAQLVDTASIQRVAIAPDGRSIAFTALDPATGHNELRLVHADGQNERTLVRSAELPRVPEATELPAAATSDARVQVLDFQWRSDGAALLFNTALVAPAGPLAGSQSDLWAVMPNGRLEPVLAAGRGLPQFKLSSRGQVLMIGRQEIIRLTVDGNGLETMLSFEPSQLSDALYYPTAQWSGDGAFALVAVADPFKSARGDDARDMQATLWRIPTTGAAEQLGRIRADVISTPVIWSDDGARIAFVRPRGNGAQLFYADSDGSNPDPAANGAALRPLAWHPQRPLLLYAARNYVAISRPGNRPDTFPLDEAGWVEHGRWLTDGTFLLERKLSGGASDLLVIHRAGRMDRLTPELSGATFDVWLPE